MTIVVLALSLIGLAASGWELRTPWASWCGASEASRLAAVDQLLLRVLVNVRFARNGTAAGLVLEGAAAEETRKAIAGYRALFDEAVPAALSELQADRFGEPVKAVQAAVDRVRATRQVVDAQMGKPPTERDPATNKRVISDGTALVSAVDALAEAVEEGVRSIDPSLSELVSARILAWSTRTLVGNADVNITNALAQNRVASPQELRDLTVFRAQADHALSVVRAVARRDASLEPLRTAIAKAEAAYFGGPFDEKRRAIIAALSDLALPRPSVVAWRKDVGVALEPITGIAETAVAS